MQTEYACWRREIGHSVTTTTRTASDLNFEYSVGPGGTKVSDFIDNFGHAIEPQVQPTTVSGQTRQMTIE